MSRVRARQCVQATQASLTTVLLLVLAACGGGGGDDDDLLAQPSTTSRGGPVTTATTPTTASSRPTATSSTADPAGPAGVERFSGLSRGHTQNRVNYPQTPPVGGDHAPAWQNCGYYSQPVAAEVAVHSMEHGAVWITYRPDLARPQVDVLRDLARTKPYVLVTPWTDSDLPAPIVASAWGLQLKVDNAGDPRLKEFVDIRANGPQTPERGAPCTGGLGTPE